MARIMMKVTPTNTVEDLYPSFLSAAAARGVKDKTLDTYKQHFRAISKRLDVSIPITELRKADLDDMIFAMRESGLSDRSINSYTRTLKVFFSWCNEEGHTSLNLSLYKASEAVKETYSDTELKILLKRPPANCNFCEFRKFLTSFNIFLGTSIHLSDFIQIRLELFNRFIGTNQLRFLAKAQHPTEELIADLHLSCHAEMAVIYSCVVNAGLVIAKPIHNSVQKRIDKADRDTLLLAAKHGEYSLGVGLQVDCSKGFLSVSWLTCEAHILHAVNTVGSHVLCVIVKSQKVVVTVID